jgi:hypothetical protein
MVGGVFPLEVSVNPGFAQDRELKLSGSLMYQMDDSERARPHRTRACARRYADHSMVSAFARNHNLARGADMLPDSEIFGSVSSWPRGKRLLYDVVLIGSVILIAILGGAVVAGLTALVAYYVVDPDLSTGALMAAVIMPSFMAYLFIVAGATREFYPGEKYVYTMRIAAWNGVRRGMVSGFLVMVALHFLAQLLMARAIYGSLEYHTHPAYYCHPLPIFYGLIFALPVGIGCGLLNAYLSVSDQVIFEGMRKLPE